MPSYSLIIGVIVLLTSSLFPSGQALAQVGMGGGSSGAYSLEDDERNLKFAGVPIPNYSDVLGASLGVVAMGYYKLDRHDDICPPSSTGLFGFYSENNSWMGAAFQTLHYDEDKWRGTLAFGTGSVKYQFNPASLNPGLPDIFINYSTATDFFFFKGSRRAYGDWHLGLAAVSWSAQVSLEPDLVDVPSERYSGPGLTAEWDRRNHIMYPTAGHLLSARYLIYDETFGADRNFQNLNLSLTGYQALGDSTRILAGRLLTDTGLGDVPFSGQAIVSGHRNLRGYANGRHRDDHLLVVETEYRWNFHGRWGAVAFAGVAFSSEDMGTMAMNEALPGAGFGLRFRMIDAYKINARVDFGWGQDDQGLYIGIGEAY